MKEIAGARIVENVAVARGTRWLVLETDEDPEQAYAPGHIVALYAPNPAGKWVRHPYTVSWAEGRRLGILYRVIHGGRTTPFMELMGPGETLRIGGRFGEPIAALVEPAASRVIGVTTGTGIGPLHGYATRALAEGERRPIALIAGFREEADIPLRASLDALAAAHPGFTWRPTLSRPAPDWTGGVGRVTDALASVATAGAHWHLVGNGGMVTDVHAALLAVGVLPTAITTEAYHNRGTTADAAVVDALAQALTDALAT
ncbi:MAG: FAD-dependent oxidoreductase [Pseudomonadota bacterium]|nr:FAD-dependent oxidoreductase [Pseudomonadota bacterium]